MLGALAVVGVVVAFSLSSTLVKRAESPGVLLAFWRMVTVSDEASDPTSESSTPVEE